MKPDIKTARRNFLKQLSLWSAGVLLVPPVFDRTCNEKRRCYQNSGIKPALENMKDRRVQCVHVEDRKFVPVTIKQGKSLKEWSFYKDALEAGNRGG